MTQNSISISVAPLNLLTGAMYYNLSNTVAVMRELLDAQVVDGFEFQNLAEWDARTPPRDDERHPAALKRRFAAWEASEKYEVAGIAAALNASGLPVLSIHANRDVGVCLCSDAPDDIARGRKLIDESLWLADAVGAGVCVFHLWDTWKEMFDPAILLDAVRDIAPQYPSVRAAIENVPTHLTDHTPFDLVQPYAWITLDLRWAALFDQFHDFVALKEHIANVHLSGQLSNGYWTVNPKWYTNQRHIIDINTALNILIDQWKYTGPLTLEIYNAREPSWEDLISAMQRLNDNLTTSTDWQKLTGS